MTEGREAEERLEAALAGRYTIEREIGRGGMATVYLAQDLKNHRPVALKVLNDASSVADAPLRFLREIHVTAGLVHPHILTLLDSDTVGDLHYYVMPYVEGESLGDRLAREGRLPVDDAVRIACEVADALAHAHEHGLVHRDIKPGNILLGSDHVFLADFGIVRSSDPTAPDLTQQGRFLGTPHYQSPEQWKGEERLDGRSDLYSLGCVLFEMLTGEPPFRGPSAQSVGGKHLFEDPPPVSLLRPSVPAGVSRVVTRAMAKDPADRFATTSDFAKALRAAAQGGWARRMGWGRGGSRPWLKIGAVLGIAAGSVLLVRFLPDIAGPSSGAGTPADTTRYAVFAPPGGDGLPVGLDVVQRLNAALERWDGLTVAEPLRAGDRDAPSGGAPITEATLAAFARSFGVGRIVRVSVGAVGEGFRVNAELLDATLDGDLLASFSVLVPPDLSNADSAFAELADHLVFRGSLEGGVPPPGGTRSLASRHAFLRGWASLEAGDLFGADSAFSLAVVEDPQHADAHLWIALTRAWRGMETPQWRASAEQAAGSRRLSPRNRVMADAILAQADGDFQRACTSWTGLTGEHPYDFEAWLGLATCREGDGLVIPDLGSPSGWSFRTSSQSTIQAYRRAFELFPPVLASFRHGAFSELRQIFLTRTNQRREGRSGDPAGTRFLAAPVWRGDSLAMIPYPVESGRPPSEIESREREEAVYRQRSLLRDLAWGWVSAYPLDSHANEALAISLSMLGDPSARDRITRARELVGTEAERLRLAGVEAWLRLAFAVPDEVAEIRKARALADSVLSGRTGPAASVDGLFLASLATLTGKARRAAALVRAPGVAEQLRVAPSLRETAPALLVYAALGGPPDSLAALEARVRTDIEEDILPEGRPSARREWLARPATLAFYEHRMESMETLRGGVDFLLDFQASLAAHDTVAARQGLDGLRAAREGLQPGSVTIDALLSETELLVRLGDPEEAALWLDPALRALPQNVPWIMTYPERAAALVRAFALRAVIAFELENHEDAVAWRRVAQILWSDADPFLQTRMKELDRLFD